MSSHQPSKLKPTTLRPLLALALLGIGGLAVFGFIMTEKKLSTYAVEVSHKKIDANASKASLQTLQIIEKQLASDTETIQKAKNIKNTSSLPEFQAIEDLKSHAEANSITLSDISFASSDPAQATGATTAPGATTTPAATPTPLAAEAAGVDISFKINDGTVRPDDFIRFLYDIEHSTPKMQIKGISAIKAESNDFISVETITVRMFTKKI
jgi:hypothetical protein